MSQIQDCPICQSKALLLDWEAETLFSVQCVKSSHSLTKEYLTPDEAILEWNNQVKAHLEEANRPKVLYLYSVSFADLYAEYGGLYVVIAENRDKLFEMLKEGLDLQSIEYLKEAIKEATEHKLSKAENYEEGIVNQFVV